MIATDKQIEFAYLIQEKTGIIFKGCLETATVDEVSCFISKNKSYIPRVYPSFDTQSYYAGTIHDGYDFGDFC
ncbi:hypothetical protein [Streptococcus azizii]|uniref:Uncharacterized protein n=1 Tax=Streptococcus azizii TaxID=1579424 RepID=A0AB36JR71_9STRE|nr:hypothetical protein [Streptococcus azizii]ONK25707.1 hypothetical protein BVE86_09360 [Streptococcus azizii]